MSNAEVGKVLKYIEENMRVTDQTSIEYLDSQGNIERLSLKQNHIIFGRRGSGKSLLLKSLKEQNKTLCISINLEDFKDISFPNSITHVQKSIIEQLLPICKKKYNYFTLNYWKKSKKIIKRLNQQVDILNNHLHNPDEYDESIKKKASGKISLGGKGNIGGNSLNGDIGSSREVETSKKVKIDKLDMLKNELTDVKKLFNDVSKLLEQDIFLIFDDFYFIRKDEQPYFLDFFHRLTKNTPLYLKVATIKHRSRLYVQSDTFVGIEIPHDAQDLNLDYSLVDFSSLVVFMKDLLSHINVKVGVSIDYNKLITENAFRFLCLASGGVPRDFFSLLISLKPLLSEGKKAITKPNVIEKAIENIANKRAAFKTDTADEEGILEYHLKFITQSIIDNKRWNSFLVSNSELQSLPQINQAIKELVDLRFLHLVNPNISAANSDGTRYSAYMIDIGLFPNSNPRDFQQVEPGQKDAHHREDKIRSAPKLNLVGFQEYINQRNFDRQLGISES